MEIDQDQLLEEQDPLIPHSEIRPTTETQSTALLELPRAPTGNELKQKFMAYRVSDTSHRLDLLRVSDTSHRLDLLRVSDTSHRLDLLRVSDTSHRLDLLRVSDTRHRLDFIESLMLVIG